MSGFLQRRGRFYFILFIEQVTVLRIILLNLQMLKMTLIDFIYLFMGGLQISQIVSIYEPGEERMKVSLSMCQQKQQVYLCVHIG